MGHNIDGVISTGDNKNSWVGVSLLQVRDITLGDVTLPSPRFLLLPRSWEYREVDRIVVSLAKLRPYIDSYGAVMVDLRHARSSIQMYVEGCVLILGIRHRYHLDWCLFYDYCLIMFDISCFVSIFLSRTSNMFNPFGTQCIFYTKINIKVEIWFQEGHFFVVYLFVWGGLIVFSGPVFNGTQPHRRTNRSGTPYLGRWEPF